MKLEVNKSQRTGKQRAHTATHLLHAELNKIIDGTKQAGSLVEKNFLRFDFTTQKPLTNEQIRQIENNINNIIDKDLKVEKFETSIENALEMGAKAFFDEKYGNNVRVISIKEKNENSKFVSIELCGGTHIENTGKIGAFKIIGQESVSSGVRRINAVVGPKVFEEFQLKENEIQNLAENIGCNEKQLEEKLSKLIKELQEYKSLYESTKTEILTNKINKINHIGNSLFDIIINTSKEKELESEDFKSISEVIKNIYINENILVYNEEGKFILIINKTGNSAKDILKEKGIKGGGNDNFVQGKDIKIKELINNI